MEEQKIITTQEPKFCLRKSATKGSGYGWDIASSSPEDKDKLEKIINMVIELNEKVEKKFPTYIEFEKKGKKK